jgi:hypothetical protein
MTPSGRQAAKADNTRSPSLHRILRQKPHIPLKSLNLPVFNADFTGMFPLSTLLSHAELTTRSSDVTNVGEARRAPRRARYGNLTLFPHVERGEIQDANVVLDEDEPRVIACISNVSATGVGLIVSEELPSGLEFDVDWDHEERPVPLRFEVVHCRPVSAGMYRAGARLIAGILPEEPVPTEFISLEMPEGSEPDVVDSALPDAPASLQFAGGVLKFEPESYRTTRNSTGSVPAGTFEASSAFGFDKTERLDGVTTCGWERSITLRREGGRLWVYIHSPGKKNGWGVYVDPDQFEAALGRVQKAAQSPFVTTLAA